MNEIPTRLKWLTFIVRAGVVLGAASFVLFTPYFWSNEDLVRQAATATTGLSSELVFIDDRARGLGALSELPLTALSLFGLWQLWWLFGQYSRGHFYIPATQTYLRRFSWALLAGSILSPIQHAVLSVVFTLGNPSGEKTLTVGFSGDNFLFILSSAVLVAISIVLSEAARMAEENKLFV